MLPPEISNEDLQKVHAWLHGQENPLEHLTNPTKEDAELLGRFVIYFTSIEFNLRRALEVFAVSGLLSEAKHKKRNNMTMPQILTALKGVTAKFESNKAAECAKALGDIEYSIKMRNLLVHWTFKKTPDGRFYILFTRSSRDAQRVINRELERDEVANAVLEIEYLRKFEKAAEIMQTWIAKKVGEWFEEFGEAKSR